MTMLKMSTHEALSKLKLYSNKIDSLLNQNYVIANKNSNKIIGGRTVKEVEEIIKSNLQSLKDLIENKKRVKDAIVKSNASTVVTIAGKEMTVAEAIERKSLMVLEKQLLSVLQQQFNYQNSIVETNNSNLQNRLDDHLSKVVKDKQDTDTITAISEAFKKSNEMSLIDPSKIQNYIDKLEKEIQEFESEVDFKLSESNSLTSFEVDLV